jgi:hypothetical protein
LKSVLPEPLKACHARVFTVDIVALVRRNNENLC